MENILALIRRRIRLFKYAVIGALSAGIKFTVYSVLLMAGIRFQLAATIAYILSACFHFTANRQFTFRNHTGTVRMQVGRYLVLAVINYTVTMEVISYSIEYFHLNPYFSMILAIAANTLTNYLMSKLFVFRVKPILVK